MKENRRLVLISLSATVPLGAAAQATVEGAASGVAASASMPRHAMGKAQAPSLSEWGLAVFACAALLMVLLVVLKRYGRRLRLKGFGTQNVQILEKTSLGPGSALVVVAYRGRQLLLATGAHTQCLRDDPLDAQGISVNPQPGPPSP